MSDYDSRTALVALAPSLTSRPPVRFAPRPAHFDRPEAPRDSRNSVIGFKELRAYSRPRRATRRRPLPSGVQDHRKSLFSVQNRRIGSGGALPPTPTPTKPTISYPTVRVRLCGGLPPRASTPQLRRHSGSDRTIREGWLNGPAAEYPMWWCRLHTTRTRFHQRCEDTPSRLCEDPRPGTWWHS